MTEHAWRCMRRKVFIHDWLSTGDHLLRASRNAQNVTVCFRQIVKGRTSAQLGTPGQRIRQFRAILASQRVFYRAGE
eukprot:364265-Chlamydomonas_euryale.AAC.11